MSGEVVAIRQLDLLLIAAPTVNPIPSPCTRTWSDTGTISEYLCPKNNWFSFTELGRLESRLWSCERSVWRAGLNSHSWGIKLDSLYESAANYSQWNQKMLNGKVNE